MSELDLTRSESKSIYKEIEEYIQNKYGLHVTNLYIAQVKRGMYCVKINAVWFLK